MSPPPPSRIQLCVSLRLKGDRRRQVDRRLRAEIRKRFPFKSYFRFVKKMTCRLCPSASFEALLVNAALWRQYCHRASSTDFSWLRVSQAQAQPRAADVDDDDWRGQFNKFVPMTWID